MGAPAGPVGGEATRYTLPGPIALVNGSSPAGGADRSVADAPLVYGCRLRKFALHRSAEAELGRFKGG